MYTPSILFAVHENYLNDKKGFLFRGMPFIKKNGDLSLGFLFDVAVMHQAFIHLILKLSSCGRFFGSYTLCALVSLFSIYSTKKGCLSQYVRHKFNYIGF